MKSIVHVNQHNIRHNIKCEAEDRKPVLTVKSYKSNRYGNTARLMLDGVEVARIVYRPNKPLSCGARVWIETTNCEVMVSDSMEGDSMEESGECMRCNDEQRMGEK